MLFRSGMVQYLALETLTKIRFMRFPAFYGILVLAEHTFAAARCINYYLIEKMRQFVRKFFGAFVNLDSFRVRTGGDPAV